ncbi:MAG: hypothetical protein D6744_10760 [Planctomycetota bacterium]|nr:MAG: hypothetical protein D6744_10760 [Planctomycetota bacterium]
MRFARWFLFLLAIGPSTSARAEDWPNFRGPRYDGISAESGLRTRGDAPPERLWSADLGEAFSSFAVVGDRAYTCGDKNKKQNLYCLDASSGEIIWQRDIEREYPESHGSGTRATPTVDEGRVYIMGAHGRLVCYDAAEGKELWSHTYRNPPTWGYSASVLIEGDKAIVQVGGKGAVVALNKETGAEIWKSCEGDAGYATPYPFKHDGKRYVAVFLGDHLSIVDPLDGRVVFNKEWKTSYKVNAAAPIYHDGYLLMTSGYHQGAALLKLRTDGDRLAADEVWRSDVLLNKFQSCILYEGRLYTSDQRALKCVDFLTGEELWSQNRVAHGTLVLADSHLFLLTEKGELRVAPISPTGFVPTWSAKILDGRCWTVPVIHNGRLFARSLKEVACFDIAAK